MMRMGNGHFVPEDLRCLDGELGKIKDKQQPIIFVIHYPLDTQVDNWYELLDRAKKFNTQAILVGHGHENGAYSFEGIPGVMGCSVLCTSKKKSGFNIVELTKNILFFSEKQWGNHENKVWNKICFGKRNYLTDTTKYSRPAFLSNSEYPEVAINVVDGIVYIGASDNKFRAIELKTGKLIWSFDNVGDFVETRPLVYGSKVILGACDSYLYALNKIDGTLAWKWSNQNQEVLYSPAAVWPVASDGKIFIVAPDRYMTAIDSGTGQTIWRSNRFKVRECIGISEDNNPIFTRTMTDTALAFNAAGNKPDIKWVVNARYGYDIDPSMTIEKNGKIYVGTKNGYVYCLDSHSGRILWNYRTGESLVNTLALPHDIKIILSDMDDNLILLEENEEI